MCGAAWHAFYGVDPFFISKAGRHFLTYFTITTAQHGGVSCITGLDEHGSYRIVQVYGGIESWIFGFYDMTHTADIWKGKE